MSRINFVLISIVLTLFSVIACSETVATEGEINLDQLATDAQSKQKVHIIYFSASYCSYCKQLTEDVLNAVRVNKDYQSKIVLTEVQIDSNESLYDFNKQLIDPEDFSNKYDIQITPTLIFVDNNGKEVVKRSVGYQSNEFYWYYFDKKIALAKSKLYAK